MDLHAGSTESLMLASGCHSDTGPLVGAGAKSDEDVELEIARDRAAEFPSD